MRKFFFIPVAFLFAVLPFISCSALSSDNSSSGISVRMPSRTAAREAVSEKPEWAKVIEIFTVTVESDSVPEGAEKFSQSKEAKWGEEAKFSEIPAGNYIVTVVGKDSSDKNRAEGSASAVVKEDEVTEVMITLNEVKENPQKDEPATYGGTVSFNNVNYETLAEALNAAKYSDGTDAKTITLNGNIKESMLTTIDNSGDSPVTNLPYYIQGKVIIDLNGQVLNWAEFTEDMKDENNSFESPLFQVAPGDECVLVLKNGTITSDIDVDHSNIMIGTEGGTVVLEDITIKDVAAPYILSVNKYAPENGTSHAGSLYCTNVTIKDCDGLVTSVLGTQSLGVPVFVGGSEIYARNMNIIDCTGESGLAGILLNDGSSGAFVGGKISLNEPVDFGKMDGSALAIIGSSLYVSSATIFANSDDYGAPVKVVSLGSLNLADGFKFKEFDIEKFESKEVNSKTGSEYITVGDFDTPYAQSANKIVCGTSADDSSSTQKAIILGTDSLTGALYISGNSPVYGVIDLFFKSSIGVTGEIKSSEAIKVKFENIEKYATDIYGDYPIFWAAGSENASDNKEHASNIPNYFEIFDSSDYVIADSAVKVKYAQGENNGNTIYAPVAQQ